MAWGSGIPLKALFIVIVFATNAFGIRAAGRFNDVLTIAKLGPLILVVIGGLVVIGLHSGTAMSNFTPFGKGSLGDLGQAFVLIFWAYAGFELSTLPSDEIKNPQKTIPKAMVAGMLVVAVFYLATNFVVIGTVNQATLANSQSPLLDAGSSIFGSVSGLANSAFAIVGIGALVSILGADESGTIGTSRLAYAMSVDGLFPRAFSVLGKKSNAPLVGLAVICGTAFVASILGGLTQLIAASVFLLAFSYLFTCISAFILVKRFPERSTGLVGRRVIPAAGILFSLLLMSLVAPNLILTSAGLLLVGVPFYILFSPKKEQHDLREAFLSREAILRRTYEQGERFLAHPWRHLTWLVYGRRHEQRPFIVSDALGHSPKE